LYCWERPHDDGYKASSCAVGSHTNTLNGGEVTLSDGVDELIRGEQAFEAMYDSSAERYRTAEHWIYDAPNSVQSYWA